MDPTDLLGLTRQSLVATAGRVPDLVASAQPVEPRVDVVPAVRKVPAGDLLTIRTPGVVFGLWWD